MATPEQIQRVRGSLEIDDIRDSHLIKVVEDTEDADWLLRISRDSILLIPANAGMNQVSEIK